MQRKCTMLFVPRTMLRSHSKLGALLIFLLIYGLLTLLLNINLTHFKTIFFTKSDRGLKDFKLQNDPDVRIVSRLFNLTNPGYNGSQVIIDVNRLPREEVIKFNRSLYQREYSSYVSSLVPVKRHLPDIRPKGCGQIYSNLTLPKVSVVIIFHNEHWSTLLRTVHSVMDNSPHHLLHEVVLVDDASTDDVLKTPLQEYVGRSFVNVRILRTRGKQGLMRARNLGFVETSAPVVIFLDSHCECLQGWLEPLVARIAENDKIVTTPAVHAIHPYNFKLLVWGHGKNLGVPVIRFSDLFFEWVKIYKREITRRKHPTDPVRSPAMVGCAIAVSRVWFTKLGMFDPGLEGWGGENTELSLKTWMCGGGLEIIPCSNVAHMYHPHRQTKERQENYNRNVARVARVWLNGDTKFGHFFNDSVINVKDIRNRLEIKNKLKCHSFEYYVRHVHPELRIRGDGIFTGQIHPRLSSPKCIDIGSWSGEGDVFLVALKDCREQNANQIWDFTELREIRMNGYCLDAGNNLHLRPCHQQGGYQKWSVTITDDVGHVQIKRAYSCINSDTENGRVLMEPCNSSQSQLWMWRKNRKPRTPA